MADVGDEGAGEAATKQVFSSYECRTITDRGLPHPGDVAEAASLANNVAALDKESKALGLSREFQEGVLFMTYSTLISQVKGRSRLQQLSCARSHFAAKNFVPGKEAASTKVSAAVIALQERLPKARVLYCSATGVSEVGNMAYMTRMGLWGPGTAFDSFPTFLDSMRRRGVSFLELLAMEMKAEGKYVARGLSFREAEFMEVETPLTEDQIRMYDNAVRVPTVVAEARAALEAGDCVVIGLQTTGEAAADACGLEAGQAVAGWVSPTKEMLLRFIGQNFPVTK
eukprot:XP_001693552.1 predicted protein [Chlamydomonas reinhardtii]